ncbi:MAG: hypothetical protein Ct9H300mP1_33100 [Planctomycetaceae bacterium]|nr:MAG: hypothetical protein Ct9H300mP1_33100 [Planctomycetaceae bacterium]
MKAGVRNSTSGTNTMPNSSGRNLGTPSLSSAPRWRALYLPAKICWIGCFNSEIGPRVIHPCVAGRVPQFLSDHPQQPSSPGRQHAAPAPGLFVTASTMYAVPS